jgi:hypothetical protein
VVGLRVPENFLFYLSLHKGCNERLLAKARSMTAKELEISTDPAVIGLRKMVRDVFAEMHRMKAFVRLEPLGPHILCGYLRPRHRIGAHVCDYLARRNPQTIVVLGNGSESWISLCRDGKIICDHQGGMAEALVRLRSALDSSEVPSQDPSNDGPDAEGIWNIYYKSQYCAERRNAASFRSRMPRRDMNSAGLRLVQIEDGLTLDDFSDDGQSKEDLEERP